MAMNIDVAPRLLGSESERGRGLEGDTGLIQAIRMNPVFAVRDVIDPGGKDRAFKRPGIRCVICKQVEYCRAGGSLGALGDIVLTAQQCCPRADLDIL